MQKIQATFHTNYNGWSVNVDGTDVGDIDAQSLVTDSLVDITCDHCDEDSGYYIFSSLIPLHEQQVIDVLVNRFGNDIEIEIELDKYSS